MGGPSWSSYGTGFAALVGVIYVIQKLYKRSRKVPIKDKVVMITGASSGLGEACAHAFYDAGCKVILCARRQDQLERVKATLLEKSKLGCHEPQVLVLDLVDYDILPLKVEQAIMIHGQIDVLINNGGVSFRGEIRDTSLDVDRHVMAVNYFGQVALTKALLPHLVSRRQGHIITISSLQGRISIPFRSAYSASKHALQAFCDCLRAEVAQYNIDVSVVSPGYIQTNLSLNAFTGDGSKYGVMDNTTASGMTSEAAAQTVVNTAVYRTKDQRLASTVHSAAVYLRTITPAIYFWIMKRRAAKQRKAALKQE